AIEGQFDAIVSAIAIHNVRDPERIRGIYAETFPLVKPGGCFLNYDRVPAASAVLAGAYRQASLVAEQQRIKAETGQLKSLDDIERDMVRSHRMDPRQQFAGEPASLENQLRWLREAGYDASDCLWKNMQVAMLGAFRE
ncbi:MAG TPA: hypothetical protein VF157_07880, partial [Chloroflexota bacterium]